MHQEKYISRKNEKGFTLVEVMVAVAILSFGILAVAAMQNAALLGTTFGTTWCGESLLASSALGEESYLLRFEIPTMTMDTLARVEFGTQATCSPDGTAVAFMGVVD